MRGHVDPMWCPFSRFRHGLVKMRFKGAVEGFRLFRCHACGFELPLRLS